MANDNLERDERGVGHYTPADTDVLVDLGLSASAADDPYHEPSRLADMGESGARIVGSLLRLSCRDRFSVAEVAELSGAEPDLVRSILDDREFGLVSPAIDGDGDTRAGEPGYKVTLDGRDRLIEQVSIRLRRERPVATIPRDEVFANVERAEVLISELEIGAAGDREEALREACADIHALRLDRRHLRKYGSPFADEFERAVTKLAFRLLDIIAPPPRE
jgi:hypothetical protein